MSAPMPQIDLDKIADKFSEVNNKGQVVFEHEDLRNAFIEFGKQILAAAAERATVKYNDRDDCKQGSPYVDKESITSTIDLLKP